jgi:hypothetical protein
MDSVSPKLTAMIHHQSLLGRSHQYLSTTWSRSSLLFSLLMFENSPSTRTFLAASSRITQILMRRAIYAVHIYIHLTEL